MDTYFFKVEYYNEHMDKDMKAYGAIGAETYSDAIDKIEHRFPNINKIEINNTFACGGFIFFDTEEEWAKQLEEHSNC